MPICAFDIWPDGTTKPVEDPEATGPGAYRWWHFDRSDPELPGWCAAQLPDIPARSLMQAETRPRCDRFEDGIILNLRGVNLNPGAEVDEMVALRMWVTPKTVVTVRLRKVFALDEIRVDCAAGRGPASVGRFLARLIEGLAQRVRDVVLELDEATDTLEEAFEEEVEPNISALKPPRRSIIRLHRYMAPQRDALVRLLALDTPIVSPDERLELREAANMITLSTEALESLRDRLSVLQDHADTVLGRQMGQNGYLLSIVAAVFLPLGFVTGLFGVNLAGMPGTQTPFGFALLCLGLVSLAAAALVILRLFKLL